MFKKILVPLDGSEEAEQALSPARTLARTFEAELRLVTVEEMHDQLAPSEWDLSMGDFLDRKRNEIQKNLDRLAQGLQPEIHVTTAVLPLGPPVQRLLEEARECQADLIVLYSHGRGGIARIFIGSVAERLTRTAPCPVMIVHPQASH